MKKMDNDGFSLIELIIVIAIMAVLVAIIAPNLTKYLGKSKIETDKSNRNEIEKQVKNVIVEVSVDGACPISMLSVDREAEYIIKAGDVGMVNDGTTDFAQALSNVFEDYTDTNSKYKKNLDAIVIKIKGDESDGYTVRTDFVDSSTYTISTWY